MLRIRLKTISFERVVNLPQISVLSAGIVVHIPNWKLFLSQEFWDLPCFILKTEFLFFLFKWWVFSSSVANSHSMSQREVGWLRTTKSTIMELYYLWRVIALFSLILQDSSSATNSWYWWALYSTKQVLCLASPKLRKNTKKHRLTAIICTRPKQWH